MIRATKYIRKSSFITIIIIIILIEFGFLPSRSISPSFASPLEAAVPSVSISTATVMIGENFNFSITFENTGADPGYGPLIDLVFPLTGQDGDDGSVSLEQVIQAVLIDVKEIQLNPKSV